MLSFHEPCTKLWLFDMLVTLTLLYGVQDWGLGIDYKSPIGQVYDGWGSMEKSFITMIAKMVQCNAFVPHDIIQVKMNATSIVMEALTKTMSFIHHL